nr:uncharacterized protein LOC127339930 [Lolium perenne]
MWKSVLFVLREVHDQGRGPSSAAGLIEIMESFKFAFTLNLMLKLLDITNELSHILQRKDINIVNAMELVGDVKSRLASMRESGWEDFFDEVKLFCAANGIPVPNMDERVPVRDLEGLASKMVETEKHLVFPLVYKLMELALLLPVSTASVERAFSAMKIIKSKLRNKMNNVWFNNLMICYTEREIFKDLEDDAIVRRFQAIKDRKGKLPRPN